MLLTAPAGPAAAQAEQKPPSFTTPPPRLRGPQAPAIQSASPTLPARQPDPALDPSLQPPVDNAARVGGLDAERAGGAQCRLDCAQTYYVCLPNEEAQTCQANWTACLVGCPANSSRE